MASKDEETSGASETGFLFVLFSDFDGRLVFLAWGISVSKVTRSVPSVKASEDSWD